MSTFKYGKGQVNTNGIRLLNFFSINNLQLVKTFFKHKQTHIKTWTSPATPTGIRRKAIETRSATNLPSCEEAQRH